MRVDGIGRGFMLGWVEPHKGEGCLPPGRRRPTAAEHQSRSTCVVALPHRWSLAGIAQESGTAERVKAAAHLFWARGEGEKCGRLLQAWIWSLCVCFAVWPSGCDDDWGMKRRPLREADETSPHRNKATRAALIDWGFDPDSVEWPASFSVALVLIYFWAGV